MAFTYLKGAHDNKGGDGKWDWNPFNWTQFPDIIFSSTSSTNSDSDLTVQGNIAVTPTGTSTPLNTGIGGEVTIPITKREKERTQETTAQSTATYSVNPIEQALAAEYSRQQMERYTVSSDDVINAHLRGGEIRAYVPTMADRWAEGNVVQRGLYDVANAFSVVGQSLNPFDNQITTLRGEDISSHDRSIYGAEVAASLLPVGSAKIAAGPLKQWIRLGSSYSHHLGTKTAYSLRWGASPARNGKYLKEIPSTTFRNLNQWLRGKKLPGNNWRVKDPGHFHLK